VAAPARLVPRGGRDRLLRRGGGHRRLPDLYRGSVSILVEPRNIAQSVEEKPQLDDSEARLQAIREQIVARAPLQALIERFDLYPRLRVGSYTPEEAIEAMRRNVRFDLKSSDPTSARGGTISFNLNYLSEDPRLAAQVANALATGFIKENVRGRARQEGQAADFLTTQLAERRRGSRSRRSASPPTRRRATASCRSRWRGTSPP
jgi:hypothetical protein